jgi:small-conductance mechanosensitive channel
MNFGVVDQPMWLWTLALVFGFPLLMLLLGEIILRLERRRQLIAAPLRVLRNFVLPSLALFILLLNVMGLARNETAVRIAETLLWIAVIYGALSLVNVVLFREAKPGSWQANVPDIFLDLSRTFLILVGLAVIFSSVWGADLAGLLTALGVGSLVLGLALQDSLGNIFSGIALLFERPLAIGDWVQIGDHLGKVEEINWRSIHLRTWSRDLIVVPNSELAQSSFKNFNRPSLMHVEVCEFGFGYEHPPNQVKQILIQTALDTPGVLADPAPWCQVVAYADSSITYKIGIFLENYEKGTGNAAEFRLRVWYAAKRHGLNIPYPIQVQYESSFTKPTHEEQQQKLLDAVEVVPSLSVLSPDKLKLLDYDTIAQSFAKGETILTEGGTLPGMYLIVSGSVELSTHDRENARQVIAQLDQGDYFGEKASLLSEQISDVTVIALTDLEVLMIDSKTLQNLIETTPTLANELGEVMELRRRSIKAVQEAA